MIKTKIPNMARKTHCCLIPARGSSPIVMILPALPSSSPACPLSLRSLVTCRPTRHQQDFSYILSYEIFFFYVLPTQCPGTVKTEAPETPAMSGISVSSFYPFVPACQ